MPNEKPKRILFPFHYRNKFKYFLRKFKDAAVMYHNKGMYRPEEQEQICKNYTKARRDLISLAYQFIKN